MKKFERIKGVVTSPLFNRIGWAILILCIGVFVTVQCISCAYQKDVELLNSVTDSRLVEYETFAYSVRDIQYLFCIDNVATFDRAEQTINMSDDLKKVYLNATKRKNLEGITGGELTAEIQDIRYEVSDDMRKRYFVKLSVTRGTEIRLYHLQLEYELGVLTSVIIN